MRADRLLDDLWAGAPTRRNTLQAKVARLRRALGDPALIDGDGGYRLAVDPRRSTRCACCATPRPRRARLDAGDDRGAADLSAAALARFRGELLPAAGDWAAPHRARLEEARARLLETQLRGAAAARRRRDRRARGGGRAPRPTRSGCGSC